MTEPAPNETPAAKNAQSRRIILCTLAVLVLIAAGAIIASKAGLDKALVRQQLDTIAAQLKTRAAEEGRDIEFTYGDVEITGGFTNRHAVIHDPVITSQPLAGSEFEQPQGDQPKTLRITSDTLEIYPRAADLSAMQLALPQPVKISTIEQPDKILLTLSTNTPLAIDFAQTRKNDVPVSHWQFAMPTQTKLEYLREQVAEGTEDETPTVTPVYQTMLVNLEKGSGELSLYQDGSGLGDGMMELKSIRIAPESAPKEGLVTIKQIMSNWSNQRDAKGLNVIRSSFNIDTIDADNRLLPYAPISAQMDVSYEGAVPTAQDMAAPPAQQSAFKLKSFTLSTKDATVNATADFTAGAEDKLPVGMANVTITNLPFIIGEMKKFNFLSDDREQVLAVLLQQITGTPYPQLKDVVIDVNRERGGSFKVGKSTFEELFASLLQASLSKRPPSATIDPAAPTGVAPKIPAPADKKAKQPIQMPEETRG